MPIKRDDHLYSRVTPDVKEAARRRAEAEGITLSTLVFEAVKEHLEDGESKEKDEVSD